MAASLKSGCRPRLPGGAACHDISGSNQIDSEPRRFSAEFYARQFFVLYLAGDQLLMASSYHSGFKQGIHLEICATKPANCSRKRSNIHAQACWA